VKAFLYPEFSEFRESVAVWKVWVWLVCGAGRRIVSVERWWNDNDWDCPEDEEIETHV
jgi:hypothetical protein